MTQAGRVTTLSLTSLSRRTLLASSALAVLGLAACGDESSTRQFAGGPQTPDIGGTPEAAGALSDNGTPTAASTQLPVEQLLAPRGVSRISLIAHRDQLVAVDLDSGENFRLWSDSDRTIWAVAATQSGERIAILSAATGSASGWTIDFVDASGQS